MITLKCKKCGGELEIIDHEKSICECQYCGSKETLPTVDSEKIVKLYDRANRLRMSNEFDKAAGVYESIIEESDTEAEAYWGLVLCKYGIEYVDDPATGTKIPTCHRSSFDSVMEDSDFELVMENADAIAVNVYRENAKQIEEIRKGIIEVSGKEEPYDIFICYKETDENGDRTVDSVIAQNIYDSLTAKGYRVFFSRITLEDKLGQEYEPYIFAALNSAKIMLAFGTSYVNYNAVWVKNEWSRYLKLMAKDNEKHLIPCYKDIDAYDIPKEFKHLQAQDMGKVGADQDLLRGIEKLISGNEQQLVKETVVVQQGGDSGYIQFVRRGNMALEDKDWEKADGFFEEALNKEAGCAEAYLGKLMSMYKQSNMSSLTQYYISKFQEAESEELEACPKADSHIEKVISTYMILDYLSADEIKKQYEFDRTYRSELPFRKQQKSQQLSELANEKLLVRAQQYASGETKTATDRMLEDITNALDMRIANAEKADSESIASVKSAYEKHIKDADMRIQKLHEEAIERQEATYIERVSQMDKAQSGSDYEKIRDLFKKMNGYKDTMALADKCQAEIDRLKEEARQERERREAAWRKEAERQAKKKKKIAIITSVAVVACVAVFIEVTKVIIPNNNYNSAVELMNRGEYEKAIEKFEDLDGYKDSANKIKNCKIAITEEKYNTAIKYISEKDYVAAYELFDDLGGYKDSEELKNSIEEQYKEQKLLVADVGDTIFLGDYNGNTEWLVLDKQDGKLLIISNYALEERSYNEEYEDVTWESCTLRRWLNGEYLTSAFSASEQAIIVPTTVVNADNPEYGIDGGNNTTDKVFLLSIEEANKYFSSDSDRSATLHDGTSCWWWLRSPGGDSDCAVYVYPEGSVDAFGRIVESGGYAVRPALWINPES